MKRTEKTKPPHAMHPRSRLEHVTDVFSPTNAVTWLIGGAVDPNFSDAPFSTTGMPMTVISASELAARGSMIVALTCPLRGVSVGRFWVYSEIRGGCFGKIGLKWVAVARIGLKLGGNEATRFRIILKPYF